MQNRLPAALRMVLQAAEFRFYKLLSEIGITSFYAAYSC